MTLYGVELVTFRHLLNISRLRTRQKRRTKSCTWEWGSQKR